MAWIEKAQKPTSPASEYIGAELDLITQILEAWHARFGTLMTLSPEGAALIAQSCRLRSLDKTVLTLAQNIKGGPA